MCLFACLLYSKPPIWGPNSHPLPRCRRRRKWAPTDLFRTPMMTMRTGSTRPLTAECGVVHRGPGQCARPLPGAASRPKSPSWPHGRCGHHFSADCHVHRGSAAIFVSFSVFGPLSGLFPQNALPFSLGSARPLTAWRWAVHLGPGRRCAATPMCCILAAGASQAQTPCPRRHFGLRAAHRASVAIDSS